MNYRKQLTCPTIDKYPMTQLENSLIYTLKKKFWKLIPNDMEKFMIRRLQNCIYRHCFV